MCNNLLLGLVHEGVERVVEGVHEVGVVDGGLGAWEAGAGAGAGVEQEGYGNNDKQRTHWTRQPRLFVKSARTLLKCQSLQQA